MPQDLLQQIAFELNKRYRLRYKTKLEFSYDANVDEKTIRRVLNGSQNISILLLNRLCCALDTTILELFQSIDKSEVDHKKNPAVGQDLNIEL